MREIDLIPAGYRQQIILKRNLLVFSKVFVVVLSLIVLGRIGLSLMLNYEKSRIETLKSGEVIMLNQKQQIDKLEARKEGLVTSLKTLADMGLGPAADRMFLVVDRAINPDVWFVDWRFMREANLSSREPGDQEVGYFTIVTEKPNKEGELDWPDGNRMEISGQALHHRALANFVQNLLADPKIVDVRVENTVSRQYSRGTVINYKLKALVHAGGAKP